PLHLFSCHTHCIATPQLSTLSLHDALPISTTGVCVGPNPLCDFDLILSTLSAHSFDFVVPVGKGKPHRVQATWSVIGTGATSGADRKSTRLNSSHLGISYAVFCLKKKNYSHRKIRFRSRAHPAIPRERDLFPLSDQLCCAGQAEASGGRAGSATCG